MVIFNSYVKLPEGTNCLIFITSSPSLQRVEGAADSAQGDLGLWSKVVHHFKLSCH